MINKTHGGKRLNSGRKPQPANKPKAKFQNLTINSQDFITFSRICKDNNSRKNAMFTRLLEVYFTSLEITT